MLISSPPSLIYIDRGDPSSADFTTGNFTINSNWNDLDLSSVVPANALAVHLSCWFYEVGVGYAMYFRKKGNSNEKNSFTISGLSSNTIIQDGIVSLDSLRRIQYKIASGASSYNISLFIRGWFIR